jgi:hypothetical protein
MTRWRDGFPTLAMTWLALGVLATAPSGAASAADDAEQVCVDVRIGTEASYACLNDRLRQVANQSHFVANPAEVTVTSPAPAVGTFNQAATAERLGNAFGHSVYPQRPAPPQFPNPLVSGRR